MVRFASRFAATLALSTPLAAAADAGAPGDHIVGGAPTSGDPAVAALLMFDANDQYQGLCSGTLIAPDVILTAAHCVDDPTTAGYAVYFGTELTETDPGFEFVTAARSAVAHPDWNENDPTLGNDIAIIRTYDEVPLAPVPVNTRALRAGDVDDDVRLTGWGITIGGAHDEGIKRMAMSTLIDFDGAFIFDGDDRTNTCSGDSGGPNFMRIDGVDVVVGVTSFGDAGCVETGVSTRVDAYLDFIAAEGDLDLELQDPGDDDDDHGDDDDDDGDDDDDDDDGDGGGGCSAGSSTGSAAVLVVFGALAAALRRRRPRARSRAI